jgi:hypothetical protein
MNKLLYYMIFLWVFTVQAMESPIEEPIKNDARKHHVIIFARDLHYSEIDEQLLASSRVLKAELDRRKGKPNPYYPNAISTNLSKKNLSKLKQLLNLAHEENKKHFFTKNEEKLVREFQISPFYKFLQPLPKEEIEGNPLNHVKKSSLIDVSLFDALENGNNVMAKYLIDQCDVESSLKRKINNSLLDRSIFARCPSVFFLRYLIAYYYLDPHEKNNKEHDNGYNALHVSIAQKKFNEKVVNYFIKECGINPHCETAQGFNCLHLAVLHNSICAVKYLVEEYKMDPSIKDKYGITPLHIAVDRGYFDVIKLLVGYGADLTAKNNYNNSPIDVAIRHYDIREYLIEQYGEVLKASRDEIVCPFCHKNIKSFGENERVFTACCYKFICKKDLEGLRECPNCEKKISNKYYF